MIGEVIAQLAAFYSDGATGINATIPALPLAVGQPSPRSVRILTENDDSRVAVMTVDKDLLKDGPALLLMQAHPYESSIYSERSRPAPKAVVALKWAALQSDLKAGIREGRQVMRIAKRILGVQFPSPSTSRIAPRNQVTIEPPGEWRDLLPYPQTDASGVSDNIVVVCSTIEMPALDTWALGITD